MTDPREDPSCLPVDAVAARWQADLQRGLSSTEAARRLAADGPNALRTAARRPAWRRMLDQFNDPLIYLLLAAITVAFGAWWVEGRHGWPVDAVVIALVVVLNAVLGWLQEAKAENAVAALARMTAVTSSVRRDGQLMRVPSADLVRGDLLVLAEGDTVGADARLAQAASLRIQEASLTGESEAVLKDAAPLAAPAPLGDRTSMVFKGTAVVQGTALAVVTATGMQSEVGAIATLLEDTRPEPTPLQKEVSRIGRMLGVAVVLIALIVVGTVLVVSKADTTAELIAVMLLGVSLAVAAVPEGLPAILSVVLALGVQRMARHNAIVKNLSSVETLGSATVIASDKTGTLTRAEMMIQRVVTASGSTRVTGSGYTPEGRFEHAGGPLTAGPLHEEHIAILSGGSLAGNAALRQDDSGSWGIQGDPTEAAFLVAERKLGAADRRERRFARVAEVPFSSERKMMSSIELDHEHGDERVLVSKGAPDVLLGRCSHMRVGADAVPLDAVSRQRILGEIGELSDAAMRTLAVAYRVLGPEESPDLAEELEHDLTYVGTVGIIDPPREEAKVAIAQARRAGIRVIMITGDHPRTAARIAADLGLAEPGAEVLSGAGIDALDEQAFAQAVQRTSVYARVAPAHKLRIVDALQAQGEVVAMTGDGVNDAPALKSADIGVAMGVTGTEVTKEAAKMILADDNFATLVEAVREGRGIFDNIRKVLRYLLSSNMGEVLTIFIGVIAATTLGLNDGAGAMVLPLLATQILWINLVTDAGPALAMGVDPETDDVMARKPRRPGDRVLDARMWASVIGTGSVMAAITLLTLDAYLPGGLIAGQGDIATARTAAFTVLVLAQLFNCLNARSERASAFRGLFANRWLWGTIGLSLLLQVGVVHISLLNTAFSTTPLTLAQWFGCVATASTVLWASELRKLVSRARQQRDHCAEQRDGA